jgi:signal transduction histidine kinase
MVPVRRSALLATGVLACIWIVYALNVSGALPDLIPARYGGGPRAGHNDALLLSSALALSLMLAFVYAMGTMVRGAYQSIVQAAFAARDDALKSRTESVQAMTALSGEIAHELKNPLATVKGLAAMLARDVDGRAAERLGVLRREVDRMQEILEGFLTFSRPLLPLAQEQVELPGLCRRVADLHDGMAAERGVALRVYAEAPVTAWCDARKVKAVLINLVQNALEVAPRGSPVELVVLEGAQGGARVEVRDRGPGLSQEVAERLFQPGFTTKARGNGLGLAIARAVARQHGGDVELWRREGGGCVAELVLPARPAETQQAKREAVA